MMINKPEDQSWDGSTTQTDPSPTTFGTAEWVEQEQRNREARARKQAAALERLESEKAQRRRAKEEAAKAERERLRVETEAEMEREQQYLDQKAEKSRKQVWANVVGNIYANCTFDSFEILSRAHQEAVDGCRSYADELRQGTNSGSLVLFGPTGTGKDHLATSVARILFDTGNWIPDSAWDMETDSYLIAEGWPTGRAKSMRFTSGSHLMLNLRESMKHDTEARAIERYIKSDLLVLSDPDSATGGQLTEYQANCYRDIVDRRYRFSRPNIVTLNVSSRSDMDRKLTTPLVDRLLAGATMVWCDWPSYRTGQKRNAK